MIILSISVNIENDWITYCQLLFSLITLIVGIFGVFYVVKTFRTQEEIFKSQLEVTQLENKKFLYSVRPIFKLTNLVHNRTDADNLQISCYVILSNCIARDFYIRTDKEDLLSSRMVADFIYEYLKIEQELLVYNGCIKNHEATKDININLYFSDEIGTDYYQTITGTFFSPQISPPFLSEKPNNVFDI